MLLHRLVIEISTSNPPPYKDQVWSEDLLHKELNQAVSDMRKRIVTLLPPSWDVTTHGQLLPQIPLVDPAIIAASVKYGPGPKVNWDLFKGLSLDNRPKAIRLWDEIEKSLPPDPRKDNTGISQDLHDRILRYMKKATFFDLPTRADLKTMWAKPKRRKRRKK